MNLSDIEQVGIWPHKKKDWGKIIICLIIGVVLVFVGGIGILIYVMTSWMSTGWFLAFILGIVSIVSVAGMMISHSGLSLADELADRMQNTNFVSPALKKEVDVQREMSDSLDERYGVGTFLKIALVELSKSYNWDLTEWMPLQHRIFPKSKHQYYAFMIPHEKIKTVKNIVAVLNLRALTDNREVAIWGIEEVTDWAEFLQMIEAGCYDREERVMPEFNLASMKAELSL